VFAVGPIELLGVTVPAGVVILYGTAVGVFIDLDHFVIARVNTGSWASLEFCLTNPGAAFVDQDRIFRQGDVGALSRLLSHLLLAGVVVPVLALASVPLALVTGAVLYVHIVTDVAWDIYRLRRRSEFSADEVVPTR
jgi:hypothetical protein